MKKIFIILIVILVTGCNAKNSNDSDQIDRAKKVAYAAINGAKKFIKQYEVDKDRSWNNSVTFTFDGINFKGIINGKEYEIISYKSGIKSGSLYLDKNGDVTIIDPIIVNDYSCISIDKFVECK